MVIVRILRFSTLKECFTLVLKGHIALCSAVFPNKTAGSRLDTLARLPLWGAGLDYKHGTGHGVGAFLNVHEGPQSIGTKAGVQPRYSEPLQAGMFVSDGEWSSYNGLNWKRCFL